MSDSGAQRSFVVLVSMLLLPAVAVIAGGRPSSRPESPKAGQPAAHREDKGKDKAGASAQTCRDRFWSPFLSYAGADPSSMGEDRGDPHLDAPIIRQKLEQQFGAVVRLQTLVATIADPLSSGLAYQYDAELTALVQGVEAQVELEQLEGESLAFHRDRDWLPWDDREREEASRSESHACRRELPGVILFRGSQPARPALLALLIVGESPVHGVHSTALQNALEIADALQDDQFPGAPQASLLAVEAIRRPARLVGPTFSGSALRLRQIAERFLEGAEDRSLAIISGSATGAFVPALLRPEDSREARLTYWSTTVPEPALECTFLHYAQRMGARTEGPKTGTGPRRLDGVALLQESGTAFGAGLRSAPEDEATSCPLGPEMRLRFPFHISGIRAAYEDLDGSIFAREGADPAISRHTALDLSLEASTRLDLETQLSSITRAGQDLALGNLLRVISQEGVHWVGIQATDIGDALFLARKIRDVAPDVRLAFFQADALLLHPSLRRDLLGSLVITPYPFFGTNAFRRRSTDDAEIDGMRAHGTFESSTAEGVYNAVLAQRGFGVEQFAEYVFTSGNAGDAQHPQLPTWIAALGHNEIVPLHARPTLDCRHSVFGSAAPPDALCRGAVSEHARRRAWQRFNALRVLNLHVDPDVTPPRLWHFTFALLVIVLLLDLRHQARVQRELSDPRDVYPENSLWASLVGSKSAASHPEEDDSPLDRCVIRTKWMLYATCARLALGFALLYMTLVYGAATSTYVDPAEDWPRLLLISIVAAGLLALCAWRIGASTAKVWGDMRRFRRLLDDRYLTRWDGPSGDLLPAVGDASERFVPDWLRRLWFRFELYLGFHESERPEVLYYVSYAQLRAVAVAALMSAILFCLGMLHHLASGTDALLANWRPVPALTMFVLRSLPLTNGLSPSLLLLVCLACAYAWALGRMARLRLAHSVSRAAPPDDHFDATSTPIRAVLYPSHRRGESKDEGFTQCERRLANAVVRPSGPVYFGAVILLAALPAVLFVLKPPTTLESARTTVLLFCTVSLCGLLVSGTVVQFIRYWFALNTVLERVMAHPLRGAFQDVLPALRRSIDAQVSQPRGELLRVCACSEEIESLLEGSEPFRARADIRRVGELAGLRRRALGQTREGEAAAEPGARERLRDELLRNLVSAARDLMRRLHDPSISPDIRKRANVAIASVVALLIGRHVLQFRLFLYATMSCVLLLLLAISSYTFEPHRVLMSCVWTLTSLVIMTGLGVFVQLARSPLLNHIAGAPEASGKLDWNRDFAARIVVWVLLPLLILLAAQYPDVAAELARVSEPFARTLR